MEAEVRTQPLVVGGRAIATDHLTMPRKVMLDV
jgi:hypothetical protein